MASDEAVARALVELRVQWKSVDDSPLMFRQLQRGAEDYDDHELRIAIDRLTVTHRAGWPPKVADIAEACAAVAKVRRGSAALAARHDQGDAYCPLCGTQTLAPSSQWPSGHARMIPLHESHCPRDGAEGIIAAAVNMAAWPTLKPRGPQVEAAPSRGLARIDAVITQGVGNA